MPAGNATRQEHQDQRGLLCNFFQPHNGQRRQGAQGLREKPVSDPDLESGEYHY